MVTGILLDLFIFFANYLKDLPNAYIICDHLFGWEWIFQTSASFTLTALPVSVSTYIIAIETIRLLIGKMSVRPVS